MENFINYKWMPFAGFVYGLVSVVSFDGAVLQEFLICPSLGVVRPLTEWLAFFDCLEALTDEGVL